MHLVSWVPMHGGAAGLRATYLEVRQVWTLNLDHFGTERSKMGSERRASNHTRELDDLDARKRALVTCFREWGGRDVGSQWRLLPINEKALGEDPAHGRLPPLSWSVAGLSTEAVLHIDLLELSRGILRDHTFEQLPGLISVLHGCVRINAVCS